jgi:hypothetical protein
VTPPLDVLLREYVTPGMRAAKWKKTRGNYTWQADNGDRAIITFQRSVATRSDVSMFYIEVGILPLPAAQMEEYYFSLPKTPQAWYGTYSGRVRPGRAGYDDIGGQWDLAEDDVPSKGPVLKALVVDDVAPMLVRSLNRDVLLGWDADSSLMPETVNWLPTGGNRLCLIADTAPPEEIDAEIERVRARPYVNRSGHINGLIQSFSYLADRYPDRYSYLRPEIEQLQAEFAQYH